MAEKKAKAASARGRKAPAKKKPEAPAFDARAQRTKLLDATLQSIEYAEFDKRAPLIREARALISELAGPAVVVEAEEGDNVVDFQDKLARRRSNASGAGRR
nr:MAG TPA: hypothetical protein [Caudoviricetes sp.]